MCHANERALCLLLLCLQSALSPVLKNLTSEELKTLLIYSREWNTNSRNRYGVGVCVCDGVWVGMTTSVDSPCSFVAQTVLSVLLKEYSFSTLLALPDIADILQALIPYSGGCYLFYLLHQPVAISSFDCVWGRDSIAEMHTLFYCRTAFCPHGAVGVAVVSIRLHVLCNVYSWRCFDEVGVYEERMHMRVDVFYFLSCSHFFHSQ